VFRFPAGARDFFLIQNFQTASDSHSFLLVVGYRCYLRGVNQLVAEAMGLGVKQDELAKMVREGYGRFQL
jgi:hypothetical protein